MREITLCILSAVLMTIASARPALADAVSATTEAVEQSSVNKANKSSPTPSKSGEQINWQVISSGGTNGNSASFGLSGTVSQTAVGIGSSENFGISHGFWQQIGAGGPCDAEIGDADESGGIDIDDVVYLIAYIFSGGLPPVPYTVASGDATCECVVDIDDVVYLIAYIFSGGDPPCSCEEWVAQCGSLLLKIM